MFKEEKTLIFRRVTDRLGRTRDNKTAFIYQSLLISIASFSTITGRSSTGTLSDLLKNALMSFCGCFFVKTTSFFFDFLVTSLGLPAFSHSLLSLLTQYKPVFPQVFRCLSIFSPEKLKIIPLGSYKKVFKVLGFYL